MLRTIFFGLITLGLATPAVAGERKVPARAAAPILPVSLAFLASDGALTVGGDYVVRFGSTTTPSVALADFESRMVPHFDIGIVHPREPVALSLHAATSLPALQAWRVTDEAPPLTMTGHNVVQNAIIPRGKPGAIRRSSLSATLVLRIDGRSESETLSLGGSAALLWNLMPR